MRYGAVASIRSRTEGKAIGRETGLTLLEIMVALGIGAFMLVGIISLVASVSRARTDLDKSTEQIENGRYALQLFSDEISLAGFYGQFQRVGATVSMPDPCLDATPVTDLVDDTASPVTLPAPVTGYAAGASLPSCLSDVVSGSEALVVRRVETAPVATPDGSTPYFQFSACDTDTATFRFQTAAANLDDLHTNDCTTTAPLWPYTVKTYYLASCDDCSGSGDGIPTLKVAELVNGTLQVTPLVEGVQDMHFEYGLDLDGDSAPDCYADDPNGDTPPTGCPAVDATMPCFDPADGNTGWRTVDACNWAQVVTVKAHLLVRSVDIISGWTDNHTYTLGNRAANSGNPFGDGFRRQVYSTTVVLPNVAGLRE